MYKRYILLCSDLHLDSYPTRTPDQNFRLNQSYLVMRLLYERAQETGDCNTIIIAGDLLELQNRNSPVHHTCKKCLEYLDKYFDNKFYILGNHDSDNKSADAESTENDNLNSYIPLYSPENFIYADKKVLKINDKLFAFKNHSRAHKLDLGFIKEQGYNKVNYLIGHSDQHYGDDEPKFTPQEYDESLVSDYAFFGHIHKSVSKGNKVSIGVGQRCKISDDKPQVVILDLETNTWKHVDLDPNRELMDLQESYDISTDYYDNTTNTYYLARKNPSANKELSNAISGTNYMDIFESVLKSNNLLEIITEVKSLTPTEKLERLDMNFTIKHLVISNWRSVESLDMTFNVGDKFLVSGPNGHGKSSLFSSIIFCLTGEVKGKEPENIRIGQDSAKVLVELSYKGHDYKITREIFRSSRLPGKIEFFQDNVKLELGNVKDTKQKIKEYLPFTEALCIFYYNKDNSNILGKGSKDDTTNLQLLYKILGLQEIDVYNEVAQGKIKSIESELKQSEITLSGKKEILINLHGRLKSLEEKLGITQETDIPGLIDYLTKEKTRLNNEENLRQQYQQYMMKYNSLVQKQESIKILIKTDEDELSKFNLEYEKEIESCNKELEFLEKQKRERKDIENNIGSLRITATSLWNALGDLKNKIDNAPEEVKYSNLCPVYNIPCTSITDEMKNEKIKNLVEEYTRQYDKKKSEYDLICQQGISLSETLKKLEDPDKNILDVSVKKSNLEKDLTLKKELIKRLENNKTNLTEILKDLGNFTSLEKPKEREDNFLEMIQDITSKLNNLNNYIQEVQDYRNHYNIFTDLNKKYEDLGKRKTDYSKFIELTGTGGIIYQKIFKLIMTNFSDNRIRYDISKGKGKNLIQICAYLKKDNQQEVSYEYASTGERTLIDIHFLSNLGVTFGLLILDEFLANLDSENHNDSIEKLKSLPTNLLFVSSHLDNIVPFPRRLLCIKKNNITTYKDD